MTKLPTLRDMARDRPKPDYVDALFAPAVVEPPAKEPWAWPRFSALSKQSRAAVAMLAWLFSSLFCFVAIVGTFVGVWQFMLQRTLDSSSASLFCILAGGPAVLFGMAIFAAVKGDD